MTESGFYPVIGQNQKELELYANRMKCIDDEDKSFEIFGNYDSGIASNLFIGFEQCTPEPGVRKCKTEQQIEEWLVGKYFITVENQKSFIKDELNENSIRADSSVKWYPVSKYARDDTVRMIQRGIAEVNDGLFSFDSLTLQTYETFTIENLAPRQMAYDRNWLKAITYEVSLGQTVYKRSVYNFG